MDALDPCGTGGISDARFYTWHSKYGGVDIADAKRLKSLEAENLRQRMALEKFLRSGLRKKAVDRVITQKCNP